MNLYFLVEGRRTEKKVYRTWLGYVFPHLHEVEKIEDIHDNHFYMLAGNGYPSYKQRILESLENIQKLGNIDHFFICIDTEEERLESKKAEIEDILATGQPFQNSHLILQNCCIETWFLGHQKMLKRNPTHEALKRWKAFYDVSLDDPENMGCPSEYEFRAPFHEDYLKAMLHERGLSYSKPKPGCVLEKSYFLALLERYAKTSHIKTFGGLIELWKTLGGMIDIL